jgi:hypothetical protein
MRIDCFRRPILGVLWAILGFQTCIGSQGSYATCPVRDPSYGQSLCPTSVHACMPCVVQLIKSSYPLRVCRSAFSYSFISNSSVILGEVVDRAAVGGAVVAVHGFSSEQPPRSLAKQYPLRCSSGMLFGGTTLTAGPASKVVAFQAYFRLFRHGRHVVPPDEAQMYFGRCFPGRPCPRLKVSQSESSISTPSDLYNLTPYAWFEDRYRYENTPQQAATAAGHEFNIPLWEIVESDVIVPIHKFRWRAGALVANEEWLDRYRGTCSVHKPNEPDCRPLLPRWREAAASHLRVKQQGIIDPVTWNCSAEVDGTQDSIDTTYMGLAWEEFDSRLSVTSKIRNLAKGDSQARNAAKMDADYDASSSEKKDQAS